MASDAQKARQPVYDDEISLVDMWLMLLANKWLALSVFLAVILCAGLYLSVARPVYTSQAIISVGVVPDDASGQIVIKNSMFVAGRRFIENPALLVFDVQEKFGSGPGFPALGPVVHKSRVDDSLVELSAQGYSPEETRHFLQNVVDAIIAEHTLKYEAVYSGLSLVVEGKAKAVAELDREINRLSELVENLGKTDPDRASILLMQIGYLLQQKIQQSEQYNKLKAGLDIRLPPTRVLKSVSASSSPSRPRSGLIFAVAVVLGIFAAVFSVFIVEFMRAVKLRKNGSRN